MKAISIIAVSVASLLGVAACSSEKKISPQAEFDEDDLDTLPGGATLPPGITIPDVDISFPEITLPPGVTLPPGQTLPVVTSPSGDPGDVTIPGGGVPNLSADCLKYVQALGLAFSGDASGLDVLEEGFTELADVVPEDLKDDLQILAEGYGKLAELLVKYNNDFTQVYSDPEALAFFSDPAFTQASTNFTNWLSTECQTAGG